MKFRTPRPLTLAIVAAIGVVVLLVGLIGVGVLVLPSSASPTITISETRYTILEGTNASGGNWFGPDQLSYPGLNGYPTSVPAGSSFGVPIVLWNHDSANHTVYSVSVAPPFTYVRSDPALPISVPAGEDNANFEFTLLAPTGSGGSIAVAITINALTGP